MNASGCRGMLLAGEECWQEGLARRADEEGWRRLDGKLALTVGEEGWRRKDGRTEGWPHGRLVIEWKDGDGRLAPRKAGEDW